MCRPLACSPHHSQYRKVKEKEKYICYPSDCWWIPSNFASEKTFPVLVLINCTVWENQESAICWHSDTLLQHLIKFNPIEIFHGLEWPLQLCRTVWVDFRRFYHSMHGKYTMLVKNIICLVMNCPEFVIVQIFTTCTHFTATTATLDISLKFMAPDYPQLKLYQTKVIQTEIMAPVSMIFFPEFQISWSGKEVWTTKLMCLFLLEL